MTHRFRSDIEGLRALAVMPILLFHLNPAWCPGGYAGVDIFFVISGYLITRMITAEGDSFSFRAFYLRRFFRLFPALFSTLLLSLVAGWKYLGPADYSDLARSALAALFGVSNFYFLTAVDYFNASSLLHPLLHTWSLAVEEQFYLIWPALLLLVRGRRGNALFPLAAGVAAISFLALLAGEADQSKSVFYMMPFRMFEFAIGAGLLSVERKWTRASDLSLTLMGTIGFGLLAYSVVAFDRQTPWPSGWTLVPVFATALLLLAGRSGIWHALLSNPFVRFIGRISYSLYLVHWPLIVLYRQHLVVEPPTPTLIAMGLASVGLAAFLHVAVEVPFRMVSPRCNKAGDAHPATGRSWFRMQVPQKMLAPSTLATAALIVGTASAVISKDGFPSRLDGTRMQTRDKGLTFAGDLCNNLSNKCVFGDRGAERIVYLVGDSHALNLVYGLDLLFREVGVKGIALYKHGCLFAYQTKRFIGGVGSKDCAQAIEDAHDELATNRHPLILTGDFSGYRGEIGQAAATAPLRQDEQEYYALLQRGFRAGLDKISAKERPIVIFKQSYETGVDLPKCLSQPGRSAADIESLCRPRPFVEAQRTSRSADQLVDDLVAHFSLVSGIDPKTVFCQTEPCTTANADGLFFRDTSHLTNAGSAFLISSVREKLLAGLRQK
jgi:peptidoglycan/LPS O-acetylase OafA/YrhL